MPSPSACCGHRCHDTRKFGMSQLALEMCRKAWTSSHGSQRVNPLTDDPGILSTSNQQTLSAVAETKSQRPCGEKIYTAMLWPSSCGLRSIGSTGVRRSTVVERLRFSMSPIHQTVGASGMGEVFGMPIASRPWSKPRSLKS